jgi:SH3-like domain-containing protein
VHQATLTGRRSFIVTGGDATLRRDAQDSASAVAVLKPGVIGHIRSCAANSDWCQVQTGDYRGYLKRSEFWGALPGEAFTN